MTSTIFSHGDTVFFQRDKSHARQRATVLFIVKSQGRIGYALLLDNGKRTFASEEQVLASE